MNRRTPHRPAAARACAAALVVLPIALSQPRAASAQIAVTVDAGAQFLTRYVDRGVVLANAPLLQPGFTASLPLGGGNVTLGVQTSVEVARLTEPGRFGITDDKRPNLAEARPSLTLSQPFVNGGLRIDLAGHYRLFPNTTGLTKAANTGQVRTTLTLPKAPLKPWVGASYDVGGITGMMGEAGVGETVTLTPGIGWILGARAGWAFDMKADTNVTRFAAFTRDEFAYLDLVTGVDLNIVGAHVRPTVAFTYARDWLSALPPSGIRERTWIVTFGTALSFGGTFPKPKAPAAPAR